MKNQIFFSACAAIVITLITSCQVPTPKATSTEPNMDSIRMAIAAIDESWAAAENKNDVDAVVAYHADDAQIFPPGHPAVAGRDSIRAFIMKDAASDTSKMKAAFTNTGLWAMGDHVLETGTIEAIDSAGKQNTIGKFMTLYEKRDGKYVVIRDIWNMNK